MLEDLRPVPPAGPPRPGRDPPARRGADRAVRHPGRRPTTRSATCRAATCRRCCSPAPWHREPAVLVAAQPTRGLDVGASATSTSSCAELREAGGGVLLVSEDLDELRALADRIVVLFSRPDGRRARRGRRHQRAGWVLLMTGTQARARDPAGAARPGVALASRRRPSLAAVVVTVLLTAGPITARRRQPARGLRALPGHAADQRPRHPGGAARRHPAAVHRPRGRDRLPRRLLQHRRRGAVPPRRDRGHRCRASTSPACRRSWPCRWACSPARSAARRGRSLPAWLKRTARYRRGRHHAAAQPGRAAPGPGPAQRAVAQLRDRLPRLSDRLGSGYALPTLLGRQPRPLRVW